MGRKLSLRLMALGAAIFAISVPALAQAPELRMLDQLSRGGWTLSLRDDNTVRKICLRSGRELIQLRHTQGGCSRFIVQDKPNEVVVQYTCPGDGYGRTSIRLENNRLVQVQSQGIKSGTPFSIQGEARYNGKC